MKPRWVAILAPALLAGCLTQPVASQTSADTLAPSWTVGDRWSYVVKDGAGETTGSLRITVIGETVVLDAPAYQVRVEQEGARGNGSYTTHYDKVSLNVVMDACGEPYVSGACRGRSAELDFPLREGKNWTTIADSSDVPTGLEISARRDPTNESRWILTARPQVTNAGEARTETTYGIAERFVLSRVEFNADGERVEEWTLAA